MYLGYFRNLEHFYTFFGSTYYGSRLPFILPGYVCYKILPPVVANYVLHLGFYYMALFSLYFILRTKVNRQAALLMAILMGFYPYILSATGWDYVDGAGLAYFLLTVLLLTLAIKSANVTISPNRKHGDTSALSKTHELLLLLSGMSFAAMIYTNTFLLITMPALVFYYVVSCPRLRYLWLNSVLIAGSGVILITIFLGIISLVAGGKFLFFLPSIGMAGLLLMGFNPWLIPGYSWLLHVPFMVFPFFIVLTSLYFLIVSLLRVKSGRFTADSLLQVGRDNIFGFCHLLNFMLMLILQLTGRPSFQLIYYSTYLLPTAFLAAGAQLADSISSLSRGYYKIVVIVTLSLSMAYYLIYFHTPIRSAISHTDSIWYASAILVVCLVCLLIASKRGQIIKTSLVVLALLLFASTNIVLVALRNPYCACDQRQQNFLAVIESDDIIRTYDTTGHMRFWYSLDEPLGHLYTSIASTRLWTYRLINDNFPSVEPQFYPHYKTTETSTSILPDTDIVILSSDEDALAKANDALSQLGLKADLIRTEKVTQGSISFTMTFIRTKALPVHNEQ